MKEQKKEWMNWKNGEGKALRGKWVDLWIW